MDPSGEAVPVAVVAAIAAACGGCLTYTAIGAGFCVPVSNTPQDFATCMWNYIAGLPGILQCVAATACGTCPFAALAAAA